MNVNEFKSALAAEIDARASFEASKNADNDSMQATLKNMRKLSDHDVIAEIMLASNVDASFINRAERSNARYNVYAAEKVVNVARSLAKAAQINHYTRAVFAAALALESAEMMLTHADAVAACSASVKHKDSKREKLIKDARYSQHVAANTAATQSSSSINALQTFNLLKETRDASNNAAYALNRESAHFEALKALCV